MGTEKEYDFVLHSENFLAEDEMEEAFRDFDLFEELKTSLEEAVAFSKGESNNCRVLASPQLYRGADITKAREGLKLSPHGFATVLGVTPETVAQWERGECAPDGTACNLLYLLNLEPSLVEKLIHVS